MNIETWNVRSLYRAGSLITAARELARYKLDLVGVKEVGQDKGGRKEQRIIIFYMEKETKSHQLGTVFFVHYRTVSAVKRVEFVSDRVSYIFLRDRWCSIVFLNVLHQVRRKVMIQKTVFMRN